MTWWLASYANISKMWSMILAEFSLPGIYLIVFFLGLLVLLRVVFEAVGSLKVR